MEVQFKPAAKGSQYWLQKLINQNPNYLNSLIAKKLNRQSLQINWVSPLKTEKFAEYRDEHFLKYLGLSNLTTDLENFWPPKGPQWDGLGQSQNGEEKFLIEAKGNIRECYSNCGASSRKSINKIRSSFYKTIIGLQCSPYIDWASGFYQLANRIAHLYFLNIEHNIHSYSVCIYFIGDITHIPTSQSEWKVATKMQKSLLGCSSTVLSKNILDLYIDVAKI